MYEAREKYIMYIDAGRLKQITCMSTVFCKFSDWLIFDDPEINRNAGYNRNAVSAAWMNSNFINFMKIKYCNYHQIVPWIYSSYFQSPLSRGNHDVLLVFRMTRQERLYLDGFIVWELWFFYSLQCLHYVRIFIDILKPWSI